MEYDVFDVQARNSDLQESDFSISTRDFVG